MATHRQKTWYTLITIAGGYLFFSLQFFIDSDATFRFFSDLLKKFGINIDGVDNKSLAIAIILFPFYLVIAWLARFFFFDLYARMTIESRLPAFLDAVRQIGQYHSKNALDETVSFLKQRDTPANKERITALSTTMIDLLITDLRDAFQELCRSSDIKVAVYTLGYPAGGNRSQQQLYVRNSTEFDLDFSTALVFKRVPGIGFEGFCGRAWDTKKPQGGVAELIPFWKDPTFLDHGPFDKGRSFLCLPVLVATATGQKPIAILCIDSGRRIDFVMSSELRRKICAHAANIFPALSKYIKWPD